MTRFSYTARILGVVAVAAAIVAGGANGLAPARAAGIPITIRLAEGYYPQSASTAPFTYRSSACSTSIDESPPTGMAGLKAARASGCVRSYELSGDEQYGHYLECIDERCGTTGFYWAIYVNEKLACTGLDGIRLAPGDELAFSYESYATALDLASC